MVGAGPSASKTLSENNIMRASFIVHFSNLLHGIVALALAVKFSLGWMQQNPTSKEKSTLIQVMPWCRQATSHETALTQIYVARHMSSLAPVPLSIFRSNSTFDENSECSSFEYTRTITTIFCTRHDSDTVVTCAKYRCDRPRIFYTRVFWIFIEFRIRSKYA